MPAQVLDPPAGGRRSSPRVSATTQPPPCPLSRVLTAAAHQSGPFIGGKLACPDRAAQGVIAHSQSGAYVMTLPGAGS